MIFGFESFAALSQRRGNKNLGSLLPKEKGWGWGQFIATFSNASNRIKPIAVSWHYSLFIIYCHHLLERTQAFFNLPRYGYGT